MTDAHIEKLGSQVCEERQSKVAVIPEKGAVLGLSAHTIAFHIWTRGRSCHFYGTEALGSVTQSFSCPPYTSSPPQKRGKLAQTVETNLTLLGNKIPNLTFYTSECSIILHLVLSDVSLRYKTLKIYINIKYIYKILSELFPALPVNIYNLNQNLCITLFMVTWASENTSGHTLWAQMGKSLFNYVFSFILFYMYECFVWKDFYELPA